MGTPAERLIQVKPSVGQIPLNPIPPPLTLRAVATPESGDAPLSVAFEAQVSGGAAPYNFAWSFGDGQTSIVQNPTNLYVNPGTYPVNCFVTDAEGISVSDSLTITVSEPSIPLTASADATPISGNAPLAVSYSVVVQGGTPPYSYWWTFGDGTFVGSIPSGSKTYPNPGTYGLFCRVTDNMGEVVTTNTVTIVVSEPPPPPTLSVVVSVSPLQVAVNEIVNWSAAPANGTPPYSYWWDFGDGTFTGGVAGGSKSYPNPGVYTITCTVTDALGDTAADSKTVTVT